MEGGLFEKATPEAGDCAAGLPACGLRTVHQRLRAPDSGEWEEGKVWHQEATLSLHALALGTAGPGDKESEHQAPRGWGHLIFGTPPRLREAISLQEEKALAGRPWGQACRLVAVLGAGGGRKGS